MAPSEDGLLDNLLVQLNSTGLAQKDQKLYQYLKKLLQGTLQVAASVAVINSNSGGSSTVNNFITQQFLDLMNGSGDGDSSSLIPGPQGNQGLRGLQGSPGMDGDTGDDGLSIPGPIGATGATGASGSSGVNGAGIYLINEQVIDEIGYLGVAQAQTVPGTVTSIADDNIYTENTPDPIVLTGIVGLTSLSKSSIDNSQHTLLGGI